MEYRENALQARTHFRRVDMMDLDQGYASRLKKVASIAVRVREHSRDTRRLRGLEWLAILG